jgi:hypothetical protein
MAHASSGVRTTCKFGRVRPERANHVWSYDFVRSMTHDGRTIRMLTMIDEYTQECLAIREARRLGSYEVIEALADVMLWREVPCNSSRSWWRAAL